MTFRPLPLLARRAAVLALALGSLAPAAAPAVEPVDLAPPETLIFLSLTDLNKTRDGLKENLIWRLAQEPEVQKFLAKPLAGIPPIPPPAEEILARVEKLGVRNAFISVASLEMPPKLVAGFQYSGPAADLEGLLGQMKDSLMRSEPGMKVSDVDYNGKTLRVMEAKGSNPPLVSVVAGDWYFVGTNVDLVKATLDRASGKLAAGLTADPEWKASSPNLPAKRDTIWWVRAQPIMDKLIEFVAAQNAGKKDRASVEAQFREARKIRSFAATTTLEGGKVRDVIYAHGPGMRMPKKDLDPKLLGFTASDTLLYFATAFVLPPEEEFTAMDSTGAMGKGLKEMGLEYRDIAQAVDEQLCLLADWPAGALYPSPILALGVRDATAAKKILAQLTKQSPKDADWQSKVEDGVEYRTLVPKSKGTPISPTIALTSTHLVVGLNQLDVRGALRRYQSGGGGLGGAPTFKTATGLVPKGDWSLLYLDTRAAFEKIYGLARNFAPMVADEPPVRDKVDLSLLPSTEAIAKHLSPIVLTQRRTAEGGASESFGPMSFYNAIGFTAAIAGGVGYYVQQSKAGPPGGPKRPPSATPPPTTKPTPGKPKPGEAEDSDDEEDDDEDAATPTPTPTPRGKAPREGTSDAGKGGFGGRLDRGDIKPGSGAPEPSKRPGTGGNPGGTGGKDGLGGSLDRGEFKPGGTRPPARATPTPSSGSKKTDN